MEERAVNQYGRNIYIEKDEGNIYVGDNYVEDPSSAFCNGSYELLDYTPTIDPPILREEVGQILEWIERKAPVENAARIALLYGKAGIGKSIVMHDLLEKLQTIEDYQVLGLKSDQVEFVDTDDLARKIHLAQPIEQAVKELAQECKRVVLLIDQIDALSLSLSSNRTPLRSLLKLIGKLQNTPHVRVVISCRPYDLEYDPLLDNLRIRNKWELKELTKEQVLKTLRDNHNNERLSDNLLRFLGNPLHLYLFLKVRQITNITNLLQDSLIVGLMLHIGCILITI
jgi:Cdc6-like AAA superfamily ATPase